MGLQHKRGDQAKRKIDNVDENENRRTRFEKPGRNTRAHHRDEKPERDFTYHLTCLLIYHGTTTHL